MRLHSAARRPSDEQGFTIVELMIATMVFSVILTVLTAGVISFTTRYYKGVNASTTQTTARSIMDTIGQAIQFGTAPIHETTATDNYFCAGGYKFTFDKGHKYDGGGTGGLQMAAGNCDDSVTGGKQLLGKNMRLTSLSVNPVPGSDHLYKISLSLAYGDGDLLCDDDSCGDEEPAAIDAIWWGPNIRCRSSAGSQFCATSTLTTVVAQRIVVGT